MGSSRWRWVSWVLWVAAIGCGSDGVVLRVDVRTDYVPVAEFASVRVEVVQGAGSRDGSTFARADDDWVRGEVAGQFDDLVAGQASQPPVEATVAVA